MWSNPCIVEIYSYFSSRYSHDKSLVRENEAMFLLVMVIL